MFQKVLLGILKDRSTIIVTCIGLIPSMADWYEIVSHVTVYMNLIIIAILLMMLLLAYQQIFHRRSQTSSTVSNDTAVHSVEPNGSATVGTVQVPNRNVKGSFLFKTIKILVLGTTVLLVSSLVYVYTKTVFYIVVENNLTKTAAEKTVKRVNNQLLANEEQGFVAITRLKSSKSNTYLVCINGGYLSFKEAQRDYDAVRKILSNEKRLELRGSNANIFRKIEYLKAHSQRVFTRISGQQITP